MENRLDRLYRSLKQEKTDSLLVSNLTNIRYLTGFSGSYGFLLIKNRDAFLYVDSRYYEMAGKEAKGVKVRLLDEKWYLQILNFHIKNLGFEAESVHYDVYSEWQKKFKGIRLLPTKGIVERIRMIKEPEEICSIKASVKFTDQLVSSLKIKSGIFEMDLCRDIEYRMRNVYGANPSFNTIVAFGKNSSMPHAVPSKKRLNKNEIALIDMGMFCNGYSSDLTRTFFVGRITEKFRRVYDIVLRAQRMAIDKVKPGVLVKDIDLIARNYIKDNGFGEYFGHSLGHGVGLEVHEAPRLSWKSESVIEEGMVFSVEPGIYLPGWGGVRIEDLVLVTKNGYEVLSKSPKELEEIVL
jgi:Xaa-Pro aminopeptidase